MQNGWILLRLHRICDWKCGQADHSLRGGGSCNINMRLDRYLAEAGAGTRSEVKKKIAAAEVCVNGETVRDPGMKVDETADLVTLGGRPVRYAAFEYYMLNKPAGVISASRLTGDLRDKDQVCVTDLITDRIRNDLFPAGRLDKDTEGLLLITNDGDLAHRLLSPKKHVDKTYYSELDGMLDEASRNRLEAGVDIGDEKPTLPCRIRVLSGGAACEITIREGRFHQIKRMFETAGLKVTYLKRLSMGPLTLDPKLKPGEYRPLTEQELKLLKQ